MKPLSVKGNELSSAINAEGEGLRQFRTVTSPSDNLKEINLPRVHAILIRFSPLYTNGTFYKINLESRFFRKTKTRNVHATERFK
jgi:hypothetical protein